MCPEPCLTIAVTITLMIFLRVEEEEYGREHGQHEQRAADHDLGTQVRRRPTDVGGLLVSLSMLVSMLTCLCRREVSKYFVGREEARRRRRGRVRGPAMAV